MHAVWSDSACAVGGVDAEIVHLSFVAREREHGLVRRPCNSRHPTVEGTQVVISIATDGVTSHVESSEVDSDSLRGEGRSKQSEGVLE